MRMHFRKGKCQKKEEKVESLPKEILTIQNENEEIISCHEKKNTEAKTKLFDENNTEIPEKVQSVNEPNETLKKNADSLNNEEEEQTKAEQEEQTSSEQHEQTDAVVDSLPDKADQNGPSLFNCDDCGREFSKMSRLEKHKQMAFCTIDPTGILSAQEMSSRKCDDCGSLSSRVYDLRKHKSNTSCIRLSNKKKLSTELTTRSTLTMRTSPMKSLEAK